MSKINALIEAGEKATAGEWVNEAHSGIVASVLGHHPESDEYEWQKIADFVLPGDADVAVAARNATDEIRELRDLSRELFVTGAKPKTKQREREIKDRIREIVGGGV